MSLGKAIMPTADEQPADDVVLEIWAAIALLGEARERDDATGLAELLSNAETILSGVISHVARWTLMASLASIRRTCH
jgi:hypothetical protein